VNFSAENSVKNTQILQAMQDTNITNQIGQELQQLAESKVGFLGIGYAKASNSASTTANSTNTVKNIMTAACNQLNYNDQTFICNRSTINAKNLNIDFSSKTDFMSSQTLDNKQTTDLSNQITQSIQQKASATVQGGLGFLLILLLIIAVVAYVLSKPLEASLNSAPIKMTMAVCIVIGIFILFIWLYLVSAPPLFNPTQECVPGTSMGCNSDCINVKTNTIFIDYPPLRYNYELLSPSGNTVNLVSMIIYKLYGGTLNNGYNQKSMLLLKDGNTSGDGGDSTNAGYLNLDVYYNKEDIYPDPANRPEQCPNLLCLPLDKKKCILPKRYYSTDSGVCCSPKTVTDVVTTKQGKDSGECDSVVECIDDNIKDVTESQVICVLNMEAWTNYLDKSELHKKHARFVLCQVLGIPCNIYISGDELVCYPTENGEQAIAQAKTVKDKVLCFSDFGTYPDFKLKINKGGKLTGKVGICNTKSYKFQKFCRKIGIWIFTILIIAGILFFVLFNTRWNSTKKK